MLLPKLDVLENKNFNKKYVCTHLFNELTALCPVTQLPDFYQVRLTYEPDKNIIELKSLKLYFVAYRNTEILHEEITNQILEDIISAIDPVRVSIQVKVRVRGGISTKITRVWSKEDGDVTSFPEE